jgi:hypothetical protein
MAGKFPMDFNKQNVVEWIGLTRLSIEHEYLSLVNTNNLVCKIRGVALLSNESQLRKENTASLHIVT